MKLTKKLETEILNLYHKYWDAYLNGNMRVMSSLMDENIQMIGSGMGEVFRNKKETVKYYKATADQVSGKSEVRNKKITVKLVGSNILITEESEFFVLIDKIWTFYGQARISTLFGKSKNEWKIIQQHGSLPDSRTEGGEQVNTDKIKEENLRLKEAIKRRTIELENRNRELEIETALEIVRAIAMGMREPADMLDVCKTISLQLKSLGVKEIRNVQTAIFYEQRGTYMNYEYYAKHKKTIVTETTYTNNKIHKAFAIKMLKGKGEIFITHIKGKKVKEWIAYQKNTNVFIDKYLNKATSLNYYWFALGPVALGISTYHPLTEEEITLFKRFLKVFELAYRRYLDIEKAQAQAREAQIEASLERVRAVAMSMNKSEDLLSICEVSFKEFKKLGFDNIRNTIIHILNDEKGVFLDYDYSDYLGGSIYNIGYKSHPIVEDYLKKIKRTDNAFAEVVIEGDQLEDWKDFRRSGGQHDDPRLNETQALYYYLHSIGVGDIGISTFKPIDESQIRIIQRFRNVFDLAYRRYNDITLAEAQAREAQIELALERVRARTMAMQKSDELKEVIQVVYEQFVHLKINIDHAGFVVDYTPKGDWHFWIADEQDIPSKITHPYFESVWANQFNEAKEKGAAFFATNLNFEEKNKFYNELLSYVPGLPEASKDFYLSCPGLAGSTVLFDNVSLYIENFSGIPYSDEENIILMRFGKVFQQTYTRFLDLLKAEAQAREAQIEMAFERVRSRTMAMQKSDELAETAYVLYEQFGLLGENPEQLTIGILDETHKIWEFWLTLGGNQINHVFKASIDEPIVLNKSYIAWKERKRSIVIDISGDELKAYYNFFKNLPGYKEFNDFKNNQIPEHRRVINIAFFSNGCLSLSSPEPKPAETIQLLERFAGVLEQTYTRFLDLQKAEAQAMEAQIETALERVRSKTMAMHNSQDVGATVVTLFDEVLKLGLDKSIRVGIGILEGNEGMETWSATSTPDGKVDLKMGMLDMTIHPMLTGLKKAWESGKTCYSYDYIGDDVFRYYEALNNEPEYPFQVDLDSLPENEYHKSFFYTEGILFSFAPNPISDEASKVLDRFAGVFGQTYRRYLDLRNAEARTREAKIEASLERVRSKAMAMHSPNDLSETVNVFFKELKNLGIIPIRCGVAQIDEATRTTSLTTTTSSQQGDSFEVIGKIKQTGHPVLDGIFENWRLQKEYHPVLEGADIKAYYDVMNAQIAYPDYSEETTQFGNLFPFKEGFVFAWTEAKLSEEELQIFRRFTTVLSLTYRRYIDLKEAEARSVEAVRQASLDRVRAEIASMRTTNDLEKITPLIWRELTTLGVPFFRCGVFIIDEPYSVAHAYLSTPLGKSLAALHVKIDNTWLENAVKYWRNGEIYHEVWDRNQFLAWTQTMMEQGFVENKEHFQAGKEAPETLSLQLLPFTQGMLYVGSKLPLSNEEIKIAGKLANDFGVAYSRYEDFQKLEAVNHRKSLELEEARQLQLSMLPKELPKLPNLDIAVYMKTATEVGGDYYDFNVGADGTLTVAIGDATGHGMKAGTIVSMIKALFASSGSKMDMKTYFKQSSDALKGIELGRLMMAFLMLRINTNKLHFANAAMPPVYLYKKQSKDVEEIMISGMPLGAMKNFPYEIKELDISSGDTILLLSDGLPELKNSKDEYYGYNRVKGKFKSVAEKCPDEIVEYLKNSAADWVNGVEPDDDVTFVVIKIR